MIKISPLKWLHFELPPKRNLIIKSLNYRILSSVICTLAYCFIGASLFAQAYNPIQFGNTRWHNIVLNWNNLIDQYCYFSKDTIGFYHQGIKYWKIEKVYQSTYSPSNNVRYIYDDTTARKVYIIDTASKVIKLLYDFSVNVGDSVKNLYSDYSSAISASTKVDSIKYITYFGINRKVIFTHGFNVWIEGIGSVFDLFFPAWFYPDDNHQLLCEQYNNQIQYGDTSKCENFIVGIKNIYPIQPNINVTQNSHTITITNPTNQQYSLKIINLNGQIIANIKSYNHTEHINLSNQQNQILILKITTTQHQQITSKIYVH